MILGPTASGKSDLAVKLAKKFSGEIISADSRQVYNGLNIGSGKITKKEMRGVPHHLLSVANPKRKFTVAHFQKMAFKKIKEIEGRGHVPFLVGGTGFYIQSVVDGIIIPDVKPNWKLRRQLEKKSVEELFLIIKKLDPARAKTIDPKNPRRLIRAIEISLAIRSRASQRTSYKNSTVPKTRSSVLLGHDRFDILQIGIKKSKGELKKLIAARLKKRIKGIITEVKKLRSPAIGGHQQKISGNRGVSWKRLEELGLEYRFVAQYIQGKITHQKMLDKIQTESEHYAKRQMTWFSAHGGSTSGGKRDPAKSPLGDRGAGKQIHWIKNQKEAEKLIKSFL